MWFNYNDDNPPTSDHRFETNLEKIALSGPLSSENTAKLRSLLATRNFITHACEQGDSFFKKLIGLPWRVLASVYARRLDLSAFSPIDEMFFESQAEINSEDMLKLIQSIDPSIQSHLTLHRNIFPEPVFKAFLNHIQNSPLERLHLHGVLTDHSADSPHFTALIEKIESNQLRSKSLEIPDMAPDLLPRFLEALEKNVYIENVTAGEQHAGHQERLAQLSARNQILQNVYNQPHLQLEDAFDINHDALIKAMQLHKPSKITMTKAPGQEVAQAWVEHLRANHHLRRLTFNGSNMGDALRRKIRHLVNTNRANHKILGKGAPWKRGLLSTAFLTWSFMSSFVAALTTSLVLPFAALGTLAILGLKVYSNKRFADALHQTKAENYWENPAHKEKFELGKRAANNTLLWAYPSAWSAEAYQGYTMEKHDMDLNLRADRPRPRQ